MNPTSNRTKWGKQIRKKFWRGESPGALSRPHLNAVLSYWIRSSRVQQRPLRWSGLGDSVLGEAEGAGLVQHRKGTEETAPDAFLEVQRKNRKPQTPFETKWSKK